MGKVKTNLKLLIHSLFYGMKSADDLMQTQASDGDSIIVQQQIGGGGVFADMLEQKLTKEVEEIRDKHYRVLKEADKYSARDMALEEVEIINESGQPETVLVFSGNVKKKTKEDFMKHASVFEKKGNYLLRVIQDNKQYEKQSSFNNVYIPTGLYDYDVLLTIERNGIIPRFEIEKFVKKMVVRNKVGTDRAEVDLYLPSEAGQFSKTDAILISNLFTMFESKNLKSDITDFCGIQWNCDKAWNADDLCLFKYDDVKPLEINIFDGNFVITFDCHIVEDGTDITEKFKTKDLDEKYEKKATKQKATDLFTAKRRIDREEKEEIDLNNMGDTTLQL